MPSRVSFFLFFSNTTLPSSVHRVDFCRVNTARPSATTFLPIDANENTKLPRPDIAREHADISSRYTKASGTQVHQVGKALRYIPAGRAPAVSM